MQHELPLKTRNVTVKLPEGLVLKARHRALDQSQSLSSWVSSLISNELISESESAKTLIEALAIPEMPEWFYEKDFPLPERKSTGHREFSFKPDEG